MPGTTGIEVLEKILQFDPAAEGRLAHWGIQYRVLLSKPYRKGAADYLTKPVGRGEAPAEGGFTSFGIAQGSALSGTGERASR